MSSVKTINIIHLFPDLLNLYGDRGNIACMVSRLESRGINANVISVTDREEPISLENADIVFLGGGADGEQEVVCEILKKNREEIIKYIDADGVFLAFCGGFEMLGKYYSNSGCKVDALDILDVYSEYNPKRLIGNVILKSDLFAQEIVGFENHAGRIHIGKHISLGRVLLGNGNTGESGFEGVLYKNIVATSLHGPLLPKNPMLCDYALSKALRRKYPDFAELETLDDTLENKANEYIVKSFLINR